MELRQLRYFVALAEELNVTRAAERLHITQPPLSQQIKLMENELGVLLFRRGSRGVSLTDAGRTLLGHARTLTGGVDIAMKETAAMASGASGLLRIGAINSAMTSAMPQVLRCLREQFPQLELAVQELGSRVQTQALLAGQLDLGLAHAIQPTRRLLAERLRGEPLCAVVPAAHRLARRRRVALSSLAAEDFVFATREVAPVTFDHMIATCVRAGFSPRIRHTASHLATIVQMVGMGLGVALAPASERAQAPESVRFLPLDDRSARVELFILSRDPEPSQMVGAVRAAILQLFG